MNEMTKEEVLHIAHLARIAVDDEEIEKYGHQLKQIMNEIDKINEIDIDISDFMVSPSKNANIYREDNDLDEKVDIKLNAPKTNGNYIEVMRVRND